MPDPLSPCPVCGRTLRNHPGCEPCRPKKATATKAFIVHLKRPVRLPISLLDAIKEGGIDKIESAFWLQEEVTDAAPQETLES